MVSNKLNASNVERLLKLQFDYQIIPEQDHEFIEFLLQERIDFVKAYCNRSDIPDQLARQVLLMTCGAFLLQKFNLGGSDALGASVLPIVSSITEDDTTTSFKTSASNDPDTIILLSLKRLKRGNPILLQEYRRLKW